MATRFIESTFRTQILVDRTADVIPLNINEGFGTPFSAGGTIIENVAAQAPLGQVWSFLGWSITLTPMIGAAFAGETPDVTLLGKIIGGLTFAKPTPTIDDPPMRIPFASPMLPLPSNTFGLTTIFDGRTDTTGPDGTPILPPVSPGPEPWLFSTTPGLAAATIITNYALPVPVQIYPGETMQIGLWLTPSEWGANIGSLNILGASYVVVVDDGQPQITTWGRDLATELAH